MQAMIQEAEKSGDEKYYTYAENYADTMVNDDGTIRLTRWSGTTLITSTREDLVPHLRENQKSKIPESAAATQSQMETHRVSPTVGSGISRFIPSGMARRTIYGFPFPGRVWQTFNEPALFDEVALQLTTAYSDLLDEETGLLYHVGMKPPAALADPVTGKSPNFWSRSIAGT